MPSNAEAVERLRAIADLLDVLGEAFKPEAYRRAARSLDGLAEEWTEVARRGELRSIPGVGPAIEEKLNEFFRTGTIAYLDRLRAEVPPGVVELLQRPGLGPKTVRRLWTELGVDGPDSLARAVESGRLAGVKGFGARKAEKILEAARLPVAGPVGGRRPIELVYPVATRIVDALRTRAPIDRVAVAGSFRRGRESVGDLDILATSNDPPKVFEVFETVPDLGAVQLRGPTKETILLRDGLQVDLRVVEPDAFGAALQYFTGSKDHNVRLRSLAREKGLKVNEYGVFRGEARVAGRTEEDVYASVELPWIPPELREDRGEIDAARAGRLPKLVEAADLRGSWHAHLPQGGTVANVDRLRSAAKVRGFRYVGVVVGGAAPDGGSWTVPEEVRQAIDSTDAADVYFAPLAEGPPVSLAEAARRLGASGVVVRPGAEADGRGRPPAGLPAARLVAHVGGPVETVRPWIDRALAWRAAIEVGPGPERLDSASARAAREAGVRLAVATGLGGADDDPTEAVALGFARRAAASREEVANAAERPFASAPKRPRRSPTG